ncbi:MAG: DUF58 domain-containing protein [Elusimicrobiota bacterium]|nr:DUF58 domain-containing protein [Elusimicrobiota bacterium]
MKYLTPAAVARIRSLRNRTSFKIGGTLEGRHETALKKGSSQEFSQYRQYAKGDETRFVDWKVYARKERLFIKEFSRQSAVKFNIIVDASGSMAFKGPGSAESKWDYSARLALYLACLFITSGDYAGITALSGDCLARFKPSNDLAALNEMDAGLAALRPSGASLPPEKLKGAAAAMGRNSSAVLLSDLMAEPERLKYLAGLFSSGRRKTFIFQPLDRAELDLPWDGCAAFSDMETGDEVTMAPAAVREAYRLEFSGWLKHTAGAFSASGIKSFTAFTEAPPFVSLEKFIKLLQA